MPTDQSRRAAFSLVELAIVISIIGLLVGTIVGAQSYIRTSELATTMSEAKYFINAFGQFQAKYSALPGDYANAASSWGPGMGGDNSDNYTYTCYGTSTKTSTCNGDGNGLLRAGATPNGAELFLALQHLNLAGYIDGSYTGVGGTVTPGVNTPIGAITGVTYIFDHPDQADGNVSGDSYYFDGFYNNLLRVAATGVPAGAMPNTGFMTGQEAFEIDRKFDDGLPGSGWVMTPKPGAGGLVSCAQNATTYGSGPCYFLLRIQ